ncbi:Piso0_001393 [Millerozyma farinosa CBS 7064]|uniref:tRNA wybutosine-synthesizing protein 2 n=1 Tax=Pichia sorbitophila (strain ATCC MYA-4447 / BCRC 22081 / CBS 7064 / NBRC 10061 / NRRL Y-12695) TaxID=559304 RepID=G8YKN7_PICSO|nr:Piso0_001393 [Millerozyma farinosa CBS 7064]
MLYSNLSRKLLCNQIPFILHQDKVLGRKAMGKKIVVSVRSAKDVKKVKDLLESHNSLNRHRKIERTSSGFNLFTNLRSDDGLINIDVEHCIGTYEDDSSQPLRANSSPDPIEVITSILKGMNVCNIDELIATAPKKWSIYPPMVLFPPNSFDTEAWNKLFRTGGASNTFFEALIREIPAFSRVTHVAVNKPIIEHDIMRRPLHLVPLYGDFGPEPTQEMYDSPSETDFARAFWCTAVQNGIFQTWAPRYTMFSRGNVKEKKRLLDTYRNLHDTFVYDFYAGIGYFTLSYLKNGATVFCWEINPWSIQGLVKSVSQNGYKYKLFTPGCTLDKAALDRYRRDGVSVFIFHESNEKATERNAAVASLPISHINMGLLPSSRPSWQQAQEVASTSSWRSILHVHENVHISEFDGLSRSLSSYYNGEILHLEKVKTFAPDIWHVVLDVSL